MQSKPSNARIIFVANKFFVVFAVQIKDFGNALVDYLKLISLKLWVSAILLPGQAMVDLLVVETH